MLFDRFNLSSNIFEIVFATKQQALVAKLLIDEIKSNNNEINKTQMSRFAEKLHNGDVHINIKESDSSIKKVKISYNKRQFYDRIVTPMKSMGLIELDLYKKTYKISNSFARAIEDIGKIWLNEINENAKKDHS